jgi:hypothetical protein
VLPSWNITSLREWYIDTKKSNTFQ